MQRNGFWPRGRSTINRSRGDFSILDEPIIFFFKLDMLHTSPTNQVHTDSYVDASAAVDIKLTFNVVFPSSYSRDFFIGSGLGLPQRLHFLPRSSSDCTFSLLGGRSTVKEPSGINFK